MTQRRTGIEYGAFLERLGRVTDAEFEVIEPTKEQHGNEASAGDGTADRPTRGNGNGWNWGTDNTAPCFTDAAHADIIRRIWGQ